MPGLGWIWLRDERIGPVLCQRARCARAVCGRRWPTTCHSSRSLSHRDDWGPPHGRGYPHRAMSRNISLYRAQRPIFVDASGRRQRGLQVAGAIGILSAVGYIGVLLSTVLGGPTIHSALLPLPAAPSPAAVAAQHPKAVPTSSTASDPAQPRFVAVAPIPLAPLSSSATPSPTSTSAPTAAAPTAAATKARGRPTALPTPPNRPTKTP